MEAKDTVMDIAEDRYDGFEADILVEIQAEISFKAGIGEVVEWMVTEGGHLQAPIARMTCGRVGLDMQAVSFNKFQAKLKEWGIK